jgi:two-component sensor histidine kinase
MSLENGGGKAPGAREDGADAGFLHSGDGVGRSLLRALRNTDVSVLYQDCDLRYVWGQSVDSPLWSVGNLVGATDLDIMPPGAAERVRAVKETVLSSGKPDRLELQLAHPEGVRWFDVWIDADRDENGQIHGIITTALEITERKRREQMLRALLREVSHRSKNLLAIIQSIAMQTSRYSFSIDQFLTRFRGRIQSLASSQDLVTSSNWQGADLHQLIQSQVALYCAEPERSIRVTGDNPHLNPNAALHIGLALHELAVNSVSYGALSRPDGHVDLSVELTQGDDDGKYLLLKWSENIRNGDGKERERRFGSVALERVVPSSLNGKARLTIRDTELEYSLIVPEGNFGLE